MPEVVAKGQFDPAVTVYYVPPVDGFGNAATAFLAGFYQTRSPYALEMFKSELAKRDPKSQMELLKQIYQSKDKLLEQSTKIREELLKEREKLRDREFEGSQNYAKEYGQQERAQHSDEAARERNIRTTLGGIQESLNYNGGGGGGRSGRGKGFDDIQDPERRKKLDATIAERGGLVHQFALAQANGDEGAAAQNWDMIKAKNEELATGLRNLGIDDIAIANKIVEVTNADEAELVASTGKRNASTGIANMLRNDLESKSRVGTLGATQAPAAPTGGSGDSGHMGGGVYKGHAPTPATDPQVFLNQYRANNPSQVPTGDVELPADMVALQKQYEEQLQQGQDRLSELLQPTPYSPWAIGPNGMFPQAKPQRVKPAGGSNLGQLLRGPRFDRTKAVESLDSIPDEIPTTDVTSAASIQDELRGLLDEWVPQHNPVPKSMSPLSQLGQASDFAYTPQQNEDIRKRGTRWP